MPQSANHRTHWFLSTLRTKLVELRQRLKHRPDDPAAWWWGVRARILQFLVGRYEYRKNGSKFDDVGFARDFSQAEPKFVNRAAEQAISDQSAGKTPRRKDEMHGRLKLIADENNTSLSQIYSDNPQAAQFLKAWDEIRKAYNLRHDPTKAELKSWGMSRKSVYVLFLIWLDAEDGIATQIALEPRPADIAVLLEEIKESYDTGRLKAALVRRLFSRPMAAPSDNTSNTPLETRSQTDDSVPPP